jgi:RIO kinase 1
VYGNTCANRTGTIVRIDRIEDGFDREIASLGVRIKDMNQLKVREDVFDEVTLLALYKLIHKKWITAIGGSISTGKEANVFFAQRGEEALAIKIYRIRTANFNTMNAYIIGDRRFSHIKHTRKDIVFTWTKKEFSNLKRASEAGVLVPEPLVWDRNILIMQFLGKDEVPYPQLRNVTLDDPGKIYHEIISMVRRLYSRAGLVHADLSEYNILYGGDRPYFIDMGQSVTLDHPGANAFLFRDLANINRFFSPYADVIAERTLFTDMTGITPSDKLSTYGRDGDRT